MTYTLHRLAAVLAVSIVACAATAPDTSSITRPTKALSSSSSIPTASSSSTTASSTESSTSSSAEAPAESTSVVSSASASASAVPLPVIPASGPVDLVPAWFGGVDICLRDTAGPTNYCAKKYGVVRVEGGLPERPCRLEAKALTALVSARLALKKTNPNLELLVVSTYRAPAYQQCLWLDEGPKGPKCLSSLCGPRDAKGKPLSCKKYDLEDPKLAHVFDHCAHVDMRAVDICAYDRTKVTLDAHGVLDMTMVEDCRDSIEPKKKLGAGRFFHPCGCRHTTWTKDFRKATARTDVFTHGGVDEQQAMFAALRSAGFKDNVSTEWWHFHLPADLSANLPANP